MQVLADPARRLIWVSPAVPGARQNLAAAREQGLLDAIAVADLRVLADPGLPRRRTGGHRAPASAPQRPDTGGYLPLSQNQRNVNTAHDRLHGPGQRGNAQLKSWKSSGKSGSAPAVRPP